MRKSTFVVLGLLAAFGSCVVAGGVWKLTPRRAEPAAAELLRGIGCPSRSAPLLMPESQTAFVGDVASKVMKSRKKNRELIYLEFGSGGSTTMLPVFFNRSFSYEHDSNYYRSTTTHPVAACLIEKNLLQVRLHGETVNVFRGDPAATGKIATTHLAAFTQYFDPFDQLKKSDGIDHYDMVFIDGRFRVIVALNLIDHITEETTVVVHDFERYEKDLHPFYVTVKRIKPMIRGPAMAVLRRRPGDDLGAAAREKTPNLIENDFQQGKYVW
eukprot:Polyplicarium_translucidae@DN1626_c0_g1_i3.p1